MLTLHIGNRLETLLNSLYNNIKSDSAPLKKTTICVQTSGMQRWVGLSLARTAKISANLDYVFPAALIKRMAERHTGKKDLWIDKSELTWLVFEQLLRLENTEYNRSIINYLKEDTDTVKAFRLAGRIADVFDQYQLYRTEMILRWFGEKIFPDEEVWQAELFKKVFRDKNRCKTIVLHNMLKNIEKNGAEGLLSGTAHLFGLSVIPPFFIDILNEAGRHADIRMYLLNPSEMYWGDSISDREISRREKRTGKSAEELLLYQNHPLLDNLGTLGRDFFDILLEKTGYSSAEYLYEEPKKDTILNTIQSEIFSLDPQTEENSENDGSITIASCHNPLRETEALYDYLLDTFNNDNTLKPSDILVMCTDVQTYAPYIRSVFDNPYSDSTNLPYTIADLPHKQTNRPAGVFGELIALLTGSFNLSSVIKVLDSEIIGGKFGILKPQNLALVLERNGGLFYASEDEPKEAGVTADAVFTFDRAMRRLALGLAEGTSGCIYSEASGDNVPFSMAEEIGGLMRFTDLCIIYRKKLAGTDTPENWCGLLTEISENFLADSTEYADDIIYLAACIADIKEQTRNFTDSIAVRPVIETLSGMLDDSSGSKGFITGRITFCAMLPMRSIPFRIICILGLNDNTFPRMKTGLEFDLIAKHGKKGDRTQRDSDKYLFLETVVSAKEKLYLSYTGRSESDNKEMVPSILVTELLRYLEKRFGITDADIQHRLHSFSSQYFKNDTKLYTYSSLRFNAAKALIQPKADMPFCKTPLRTDDINTVELASFERFFLNPPKYFIETVLGITTEVSADILPDTEHMNLGALDKYNLKEAAVNTAIKGKDPSITLLYAAKTAKLPAGGLGEYYGRHFAAYGHTMADSLSKYQAEGYTDVSYTAAGMTINGRIQNTGSGRHVYIKTGSIKAKDLMRVWIRHLLLNTLEPVSSYILTSETEIKIAPADPEQNLEYLAGLFLEGSRQPLYFHPTDALQIMKNEIKNIKDDEYNCIENDTAFRICFGNRYFPDRLHDITKKIFEPCARLIGQENE